MKSAFRPCFVISAPTSSSWSTRPRSPRMTGPPRAAVDFAVNAIGTMNLLEATRLYATDAIFIFTSTNKVYGDTPNRLPCSKRRRAGSLTSRIPTSSAASMNR